MRRLSHTVGPPPLSPSQLQTAGLSGGLRKSGDKADLALVVCDTDAAVAGVFTQNVMCAAPVTYCRQILAKSMTARAVSKQIAISSLIPISPIDGTRALPPCLFGCSA